MGSQFEQDWLQPLHTPLNTTNPLRHLLQPLIVQFKQFREQAAHILPLKYWPGKQLWQLFAFPLQVIQVGSHKRQLVPDRYVPLAHSEQEVGFKGLHFVQPGAHTKHVLELLSKVKPAIQAVQTPVKQALHPGIQSLT